MKEIKKLEKLVKDVLEGSGYELKHIEPGGVYDKSFTANMRVIRTTDCSEIGVEQLYPLPLGEDESLTATIERELVKSLDELFKIYEELKNG